MHLCCYLLLNPSLFLRLGAIYTALLRLDGMLLWRWPSLRCLTMICPNLGHPGDLRLVGSHITRHVSFQGEEFDSIDYSAESIRLEGEIWPEIRSPFQEPAVDLQSDLFCGG